MWGVPMEAILQCLAQDAVKDQWVEQLSRCLSSPKLSEETMFQGVQVSALSSNPSSAQATLSPWC